MLINPRAIEKLRYVTTINYYPNTTHAQRNEFIRLFIAEAGRLLDQQAESAIKHVVELYVRGDIPYERYMEQIEEIGQQEATRGAAYGAEYARNRAFDFAQKVLDLTREQAYALALVEAQKQYEIERQKSEQQLTEAMQRALGALEITLQQYDADLKATAQEQKEGIIQDQEALVRSTKEEIEHILSSRLQDEKEQREQEIREQEELRPTREAARTAIEHVAKLEKRSQFQKRIKYGLMGLGAFVFLALLVLLLFVPLPQWAIVLLLIVAASIFFTPFFWKSSISDEKLVEHKRQIALYQTGSGDYAPLSDAERVGLLIQRTI